MDEPVPNQDPLSDLDFNDMTVVGIELHEIYLTLKNCGFSEKEALFIVAIAVAEGAMSPRKHYGPEDIKENDKPNDDDDFPDDGDFDPFY